MTTAPATISPHIDAERARQALLSRAAITIRGLTPERLARALENFDLGYLREAALLWQKIKDRCDTTLPVSAKRELDAALLDWEILPLDDSPEAAAHKSALEAFYHNLSATHTLEQDQRGGVSKLIAQMMTAVGHRYAVHEIVWQPQGRELTAEFRFVPLQFFEATAGRLRFLASEGDATGEELEEGGWMVTTGPGLMEATAIAYLFKTLPLKAWLVFCDKAGMPGLHGETAAGYGTEEWNRFRDAIAGFGEDWALVTSLGTKVTPIDLKAGAQLPHPLLVDRMDRAIARIWRGADLGTLSKEAAVGANPQESETEIFAAADALVISETLQHHVDRAVIRHRFGTEPRAYFQLTPRTKTDRALELKIDDYLIRWGVPRAKKDLLQKYHRPEPDPTDDLVTATGQGSPADKTGPENAQKNGDATPPSRDRSAALTTPALTASAA